MPQPTGPSANEQYSGDAKIDIRNEASLDQNVREQSGEGGGFFGQTMSIINAEARGLQFDVDQSRRLEHGATYRPAPPATGALYQGYDHPTLYNMVTEGVDPAQVHDIGRTWNQVGNIMAGLADRFTQIAGSSETGWQGAAGDAARGYTSTLATWASQAGQGAQLTANRFARQGEAIETAKNTMPEPVDFDIDQAVADLDREPDLGSFLRKSGEIQQKYNEQLAAQQQAADVVGIFDTSLNDNTTTMPAYAPPPAPAGGSVAPPPTPPPGLPGGGDIPNGTITPPPPGGGEQPRIGNDPRNPARQPNPVPGQPDPASGQRGQGAQPPGGTIGQGDHSGRPTPPGGPIRQPGFGPYPPASGDVSGGAPIGGFGPVGGDPTNGGRGGSGRGFGGGTGNPGHGPGSGTGARPSPSALAAEPATSGRGGAGGRGAAGMGGMGGMGAGGGKRPSDEDHEHQRPSYLVEPDPDSTFGDDRTTAPPVIGGNP